MFSFLVCLLVIVCVCFLIPKVAPLQIISFYFTSILVVDLLNNSLTTACFTLNNVYSFSFVYLFVCLLDLNP